MMVSWQWHPGLVAGRRRVGFCGGVMPAPPALPGWRKGGGGAAPQHPSRVSGLPPRFVQTRRSGVCGQCPSRGRSITISALLTRSHESGPGAGDRHSSYLQRVSEAVCGPGLQRDDAQPCTRGLHRLRGRGQGRKINTMRAPVAAPQHARGELVGTRGTPVKVAPPGAGQHANAARWPGNGGLRATVSPCTCAGNGHGMVGLLPATSLSPTLDTGGLTPLPAAAVQCGDVAVPGPQHADRRHDQCLFATKVRGR